MVAHSHSIRLYSCVYTEVKNFDIFKHCIGNTCQRKMVMNCLWFEFGTFFFMLIVKDNEWCECKSESNDYNLIKQFLLPVDPGTGLKWTVKSIHCSNSLRGPIHLPCVSAAHSLLRQHK